MEKQSNKGTTLIELMISTAIISIILLCIYSLWRASTASAQHCIDMSSNTDAPFVTLNNIKRQAERLVKQESGNVPINVNYSGSKLTLTLHSYTKLWSDNTYPEGPYIIKYIHDKQTGDLWYSQKPALELNNNYTVNNKPELTSKGIKEMLIEYQKNNIWKSVSNNKINIDSFDLLRITLVKSKNNDIFSITIHP